MSTNSTILLSFLGTGDYQETTYCIDNKEYPSAFVQEALTQHFTPDQCYIALTPQVKKETSNSKETTNWTKLQNTSSFAYQALDISEQQTPEANFQILEKITSVIEDGDELILDITHSFRSIPMVALAAAFYLQTSKKVSKLSIFYGAYDATSETTPIHELTGLLDIMQWVNAAQTFQRFGDGSDFATLLQSSHLKAWQSQASPAEKPRTLQNYASKLIEASQALQANQPKAIAEAAQSLENLKDGATEDIKAWAKPFSTVFDSVHNQLTDFSDLDLLTQRKLLEWYANRNRLVETAQLAREWIVSYTALRLNIMQSLDQLNDLDLREQTESVLFQCLEYQSGEQDLTLDDYTKQLQQDPDHDLIIEVWNFNNTRNTLSHCGFNSGAQPVKTLIKKVQASIELIKKLPLPDQQADQT